MWSERRLFSFAAAASGGINSSQSALLPSGEPHHHHHSDFISRIEYVSLPFDNEAQWRDSACWYAPHDRNDDSSPSEEDWRLRTPPSLEYFLLGWSDGSVERHVIAPSHLRVVAERLQPRRVLYRHEGQVTALCTLGTLVGSVGAAGDGAAAGPRRVLPTCCIATSHPMMGIPAAPIALPHGPRSSPRSLLLWEGKAAWASDPTEGCVVYAFTGDDEGRVRLWRVDLAAASVDLLCVLGCIVFGSIGDASKVRVDALGGPTGSFLSGVHMHALCLDGEARLVAGTSDKRMLVWDLTPMDRCRAAVEDWPKLAEMRFSDSKMFQKFVWIANPLATAPLPLGKERKLLSALAEGCYVGQVVNLQRPSSQPSGAGAAAKATTTTTTYTVSFPQRSKPIHVPIAAIQIVQAPTLAFLADAHGPVTSIALLHDGFLVSGGADGRVRLWCWSETECRYEGIRVVEGAHDDLITRVGVITMPVTFFTASLDGVVKTWRIRSGLDVALESAVGIRDASLSAAVASDHTGGEVDVQPYPGVGWACVHQQFGALFALLHMQSAVRSYTYDDVDGCALPPGWLFNGVRSVQTTTSRSAGSSDLRWKGQSLSSDVLRAMAAAELDSGDDDDGAARPSGDV